MESHFASPERTEADALSREIAAVNDSLVTRVLLESVSGMVAVLDGNRQLVALNDALVDELGIPDAEAAFGFRLGEALQCTHADDHTGGCGTSRHCATCGAAVCMVTSLSLDVPTERTCALTAYRDGVPVDACLLVRACPVLIEEERYLFLFLRDVTEEWYRAALEKTFFHDINNLLSGLTSASALLARGHHDPELIGLVHRSAQRIAREFSAQASLRGNEGYSFNTLLVSTTANDVLVELAELFGCHPLAKDRTIQVRTTAHTESVETDVSLLLRVLGNMLANALEATAPGGRVDVWSESADGRVDFCVWNGRFIEDEVALRVFQRHFSTKKGVGRGLGTFSMKLFGEQILGGRVSFKTSREGGTEFRLSLPAQ